MKLDFAFGKQVARSLSCLSCACNATGTFRVRNVPRDWVKYKINLIEAEEWTTPNAIYIPAPFCRLPLGTPILRCVDAFGTILIKRLTETSITVTRPLFDPKMYHYKTDPKVRAMWTILRRKNIILECIIFHDQEMTKSSCLFELNQLNTAAF